MIWFDILFSSGATQNLPNGVIWIVLVGATQNLPNGVIRSDLVFSSGAVNTFATLLYYYDYIVGVIGSDFVFSIGAVNTISTLLYYSETISL